MTQRLYYAIDFQQDYVDEDSRVVVELPNANAVSSRTAETGDTHMPCIDLDIPVRLVPSRTEGHFHLFIDKEISWQQYLSLLSGLYGAGLIEQGYYELAIKRQATYCRLSPQELEVRKTHRWHNSNMDCPGFFAYIYADGRPENCPGCGEPDDNKHYPAETDTNALTDSRKPTGTDDLIFS